MQRVGTAVVVDHHEGCRRLVVAVLQELCFDVLEAPSVSRAVELLEAAPSLFVVEIQLDDGSAADLLRKARDQRPRPMVIAMSGWASPEEVFELSQLGASGFLQKPFSLLELDSKVRAILQTPPELAHVVARWVGHRSVRQIQRDVRHEMIEEALARANQSLSGAARLLRVSRQAVQQMVREGQTSAGSDPIGPLPNRLDMRRAQSSGGKETTESSSEA